MFCRICELGCAGAGEAAETLAATGFLITPITAAAPGNFLEAAVTGVGPACLEEEPEGVAEGHGLLGMVPLKPEGSFLMAGLAPAMLA